MIDSVLKGTGNSRFLKSAVPAGTSWADALAMLQAGTFPIDFNGINTEGFQQVGTPLNKANLLKDATAAQIGLPPSTTPDGMFQALGNTGELHVWRKTVTTAEPIPEVPGSYTLEAAEKLVYGVSATSNTNRTPLINTQYSNTISVDLEGNITLDNPSSYSHGVWGIGSETTLLGNFVKFISANNYATLKADPSKVYFIPSDSVLTQPSGIDYYGEAYYSKAQVVTGHPGTPYIPAGTTTTYPVSTNPNAYQEGDDAKAAGYVVGEVENTTLVIAYRQNTVCNFSYSDALYVADDGSISLANPTSGTAGGSYNGAPTYLSGKFLKFVSISGNGGTTLKEGVVYYIPSNATIKIGSYAGYVDAEIDRYQPVIGYAAIPAGTTIEYLGKLGDKARVQVVSYVGTGTYGSSNPNSVTASFPIKLLAVLTKALKNSNGNFTTRIDFNNQYREDPFMIGAALTTDYTLGSGCGYKVDAYDTSYGKKSKDGKTFSWYTTGSNAARQFNESGYTYTVLLVG